MSRHHHSRWFDNPFEDDEFKLDKAALKVQGLEYLDSAFAKGTRDGDGGLYVGAVGVAYAFLHVAHLLSPEERKKYHSLALNAYQTQAKYYLTSNPQRNDACAFLLGKAGFFAVGVVLGKESGHEDITEENIKNYIEAGEVCKQPNFGKHGGDELFVGRAGYLCGALWLQQKLGYMPIPQKDLLEIFNLIIESGRNYSNQHKSPCPLMYSYYDTEYLGAAHGLCSILQILLSYPQFLNENSDAETVVKATLDFYLTLQDSSGNFPCAMDEIGPRKKRGDADMLVHWCHGAPGVVYLLAKAYLHYKDKKYLDACIRCGDLVWNRGLLRKGPGICHGVAGSGYVFLLIYNLLEQRDPKHLYRAAKFAQFLKSSQFLKEARTPDCAFSLYEGIAGTACFVLDLLQPVNAEFPFFNVHNSYNG
ncbi:lanC-like protein 3 homolog [Folsomia candida]|uniref:lanC-like protein 3 homolog n=1 Tax=Folsomia candida TaxID=158441 RepID=UPI000B900BF4|nr:lanC-like protein 3 homolog [Folsomia candida]